MAGKYEPNERWMQDPTHGRPQVGVQTEDPKTWWETQEDLPIQGLTLEERQALWPYTETSEVEDLESLLQELREHASDN